MGILRLKKSVEIKKIPNDWLWESWNKLIPRPFGAKYMKIITFANGDQQITYFKLKRDAEAVINQICFWEEL
jgi:hypothetical protein